MVQKTSQLNAIDKFIGHKTYSLQLVKRITRQQLSKVIGFTHRQLQKYETGAHPVTASRLLLIAKALEQEVPYFYQGFEAGNNSQLDTESQRLRLEVARNLRRICYREHQDAINILVKSLLKERVA